MQESRLLLLLSPLASYGRLGKQKRSLEPPASPVGTSSEHQLFTYGYWGLYSGDIVQGREDQPGVTIPIIDHLTYRDIITLCNPYLPLCCPTHFVRYFSHFQFSLRIKKTSQSLWLCFRKKLPKDKHLEA